MLLAAITAAGNAQFFVEGSASVDFKRTEATYYGYGIGLPMNPSPVSNVSFVISPLVGYRLNDNIEVGVKVEIARKNNRQTYDDPDNPGSRIVSEYRERGWNFSVFDRYKLWGTEKLSMLVECSIFFSEHITEEQIRSITKKIEYRSSMGINLVPLATYDISNKFSLITRFYFLGLTLDTLIVKNEETGMKNRYNDFMFHAVSSSNPLSGLRIGFIYHF